MTRSPLALLLFPILIADVAPVPGGCGGSKPQRTVLQLRGSDCACLPASVDVAVDASPLGRVDLRCDASTDVVADLTTGTHTLTVKDGAVVWFDKSIRIARGDEVRIDLACPRR